MRRLVWLWLFAGLLLTGAWGQVSIKPGIPLIVPGTGLGWETDTLRLVVRVDKPGPVEIRLYSPGFDPRDYRSPNELGDERYDGGKGRLEARYLLRRGERILAQARFGIEPHRWVRFFRGRLEPGEYLLEARFVGNGKNAVIFEVRSEPGVARLMLAPSAMQTYNVVRNGWQTPFRLKVPLDSPGLRVGIYDGDGPGELRIRVRTPEGTIEPEVPGDRAWLYLDASRAGEYAFAFLIPEGARQHTNTVGFRLFLGEIRVEIVDEAGNPVSEAGYRVEGEYVREVWLEKPEGWALVRTEVEHGEQLAPDRVRFGLGAGRVRFVLRRVAPEPPARPSPATLRLSAELVCGDWRRPEPLAVRVDGKEYRIGPEGLELRLEPGVHTLQPLLPAGAEGPGSTTLRLEAGEARTLALELRPAVALALEAPSRVERGEGFTVSVRAGSDYPRPFPAELRLQLPPGLELEGDPVVEGELGGGRGLELRARVRARVPGTHRIRAELLPCGRQATAELRVLAPEARLDRRVEPAVLLPGEETRVCLRVEASGDAPLRYRLRDRTPDWLRPLEPTTFSGTLAPGKAAEHCYRAEAGPGPEAEGRLVAVLEGNAGRLEHRAPVRRVPLALEKRVEDPEVVLGEPVRFELALTNPLDRPVRVRLVDEPDAGLGLARQERVLELAAGETLTLPLEGVAERPGTLRNRATVFSGEVPAAPPAEAEVRVAAPRPEARVSEVRLEFAVRQGGGEALLLRHRPPAGGRYRPGSSRLDGEPVADPRIDDSGRLYWRIPFRERGTLTYVLEHEEPLPPLAEPELTLLASGRALPLQGSLDPEAFARARPLVARIAPGPAVRATEAEVLELELARPARVEVDGRLVAERAGPGKVSVPLEPGPNRIVLRSGEGSEELLVYRAKAPARARLVPLEAVADGRSPLVYTLVLEDEDGYPAAADTVTLEAEPEPRLPDADPLASGYQLPVEAGKARLVLEPRVRPGTTRVRVLLGERVVELEHYVEGPERTLYLAQGSVTVRVLPALGLGGLARGYAEAPLGDGYLQAALDLTYADGGLHRGLGEDEDPLERFPLTGAGGEAKLPLVSDDGVAFRYDRGSLSVGYGRIPEGYSALYLEHRGDLGLRAHAALLAPARVTERIRPDGTRIYVLRYPVEPGSERVYLEKPGGVEPLVPLRDYTLDPITGTLYLARPLWPTDEVLIPQTLVVEYAPIGAARENLAFGVAGSYRAGPFRLAARVGTRDRGETLEFGLEAGYRDEGIEVRASYRRAGGRDGYALYASGRRDGIAVSADLAYGEGLRGRARLAADLTARDRVAVEHEGNLRRNETRALYERELARGLAFGLGLGYRWEEASPSGLGRLAYADRTQRYRLTHSQPFAGAPRTSLELWRAIDANLSVRGDLAYAWGAGFEGWIGLEQKVGPANLTLSYRLPGASGEGNRARFGVRAPWPLDARWRLDTELGAAYDFGRSAYQAAAGAALRYRTPDFSASLGANGAWSPDGAKLTVRAGASGTLDDRQAVSADLNYQVSPEPRGRFTLAYAYRGEALQVLTYHRYRTHPEPELEGELAVAWHPGTAFQLRPSAAYRYRFADPAGNTYQLGLGANYYLTRRFGLGGGIYYVLQPATGREVLAYAVEGSWRALDPVWLNLGYTFGDFGGLTMEARPGLYLRLDLFAGSDP